MIGISKMLNCAMLLCMAQFFSMCQAQKTCVNCGIVVEKTRYFDRKTNQFIPIPQSKDRTMWYKDSLVIQEINHVYQNEDINHNTTWNVQIERYKFIDLRSKDIYEYYTFSDTAKMIKKCLPNDSGCIGECWRFWKSYHFMETGKLSNLPDTLIGRVNYRRVTVVKSLKTDKGGIEVATTGYFRCDIKDGLFMFDQLFSKKIGCPMVCFEERVSPPVYSDTRGEIEYLPRKLTQQELRVFAAWERNAKDYNPK
jgi:hypothetical protein